MFYTGAVNETATDLALPGPIPDLGWTQTRSYNSRITGAAITHLGRNWISGNDDVRLMQVSGGGGDLYLLTSASSKRTFKYVSGAYQAMPGSSLELVADGTYLKLTDIYTGERTYFHNFSQGSKSGRVQRRTTRAWEAASKTGQVYDYDGYGRLTTITTAQGQDAAITFQYISGSSWALDWIRVGGGSYYMEVDYTYGATANTHADCGADDDLVQVRVRRKGTDGAWIERYTQYRYHSDGKLKSVFESEAIQRIIDAYSGINSPADLLAKADSYADSSLSQIHDVATRSFTYHTADETTYDSDYSGYAGASLNETGFVKSETVQGGQSSCCGGTSAGVTLEYHYIKGTHVDQFNATDLQTNPTADGHLNIVRWIVVEDVKNGSTLLRRNVFGLSDGGYLLRKATLQTPSSGSIWCTSQKLRNDRRISERRAPSAHTSVNSTSSLKTFLNPYNGTTWTDSLDSGLIHRYTYNNEGWPTSELVKMGPGGTEYYVSATDYGNGTSEAAWEVKITYAYPTQITNRSLGIATTYSYIYWDGVTDFRRRMTITETLTAVPLAENGSNVATSTTRYFDQAGRLRWTKDGEGYVNYYSYDPDSGQQAYTAVDVNPGPTSFIPATSAHWLDVSEFGAATNQPARGPSATEFPPLSLVTTRQHDNQGRLYKTTDPNNRLHYVTYQNNRMLRFPYWDSSATDSLLPIEATIVDNGGGLAESYSIRGDSASVSTTASEPTGLTATPARSDYVSWTRYFDNPANGQMVKALRYHVVPDSGDGSHITDYYVTAYAYDVYGRRTTTVESSTAAVHQIAQTDYDFLDRVTSTKRDAGSSGVNTGANSTLGTLTLTGVQQIVSTVYDSGGVGDGHVTNSRTYYGTGTNDYVERAYKRTYRGHLRGMESNNGGSAVSPYAVHDVDWIGRTTGAAQYSSAVTWSSVLTGDGYAAYLATNGTGRNEWTKTSYDVLDRVFRTERFPGTQATNHLEVNNYYDRNGQLVATGDKYSAHTEYAYDGAGRQYQNRTVLELEATKYSSGKFSYRAPEPKPKVSGAGGDVMDGGDDLVIAISHTVFDASGNSVEKHHFENHHDDSNGIDLTGDTDYVRRSLFHWYDAADRLATIADYGSGDGTSSPSTWQYTAAIARPSEPGWTSGTVSDGYVLLTKYSYDSLSGRPEIVTTGVRKNGGDTTRVATKTFYDDLGRPTYVAENYVNFTPPTTGIGGGTSSDEDRVTKWEYIGSGEIAKLIAYNGASGNAQTTVYLYEDTIHADLATNAIYPDSSDTTASGTDQVTTEYFLDRLPKKRYGQGSSGTDRTIHEFMYNNRRQLELDKITQLGTGIDGAVLSIRRSYDSLGRLEKTTSYADAAGTTTVLNEVKHAYGSLGLVTTTDQDHTDAVGSGAAHRSVDYAYDADVVSSVYADGLRLETVTYPGPATRYVSYLGYGGTGSTTDVNDRLSRVKELRSTSSTGTQRTGYAYSGEDRLVRSSYAAFSPNLSLDYNQDDGADYEGFDRFGRIASQKWVTASGTVRDQFDYQYDYAGNRLSRDIPNTLYGTNDKDQLYAYDALMRLKNAQTGTLSGGSITSRQFEQDWTLEQLGNWGTFKERDTDTGSNWDVTRICGYSLANELSVVITGPLATPQHDAAGNMTTMPQPAAPTASYALKYDAWNRLVEVKAGSNVVQQSEYDGRNRRIVRSVYTSGGALDHRIHYYYNDQWQILEERKETGGTEDADPLNQYVWHPYYVDALALSRYDADTDPGTGNADYYYLQDANYNITAAVDSSGGVAERYAYSPYGEVRFLNDDFSLKGTQGTVIGNAHLYTGRERDPETRLQLNRNRFYASWLGRWVSRDPIITDTTFQADPRGEMYMRFAIEQSLMPVEIMKRYLSATRGEMTHLYNLDSRMISAPGKNLYQYVSSRTIDLSDPTGLAPAWQNKCDPNCPTGPGPMPPPPQNPPKPNQPCSYPNRRVCETKGWYPFTVTVCWESQCVCQCMGNSPGANCMRGCIKCADDNGAPGTTIEAEEYCQEECDISHKEKARLVCCTVTEISNGGCLGNPFAWKDPPPMNPPPGNKCFNNNK